MLLIIHDREFGWRGSATSSRVATAPWDVVVAYLGHDLREEEARRAVADADRKLARHRAVLEALDDSDPALVAGWITQVQAERSAAAARLSERTSETALTRDEIEALVGGFTDHVALITEADAADRSQTHLLPEPQRGDG